MLYPKTGANHYHAQLEFPEKSREMKELVDCRTFNRVIIHIIHKIWFRDTLK